MTGPEKRSLETFTERLGLGAVYQTTEGSRYMVIAYGAKAPMGERETRYVKVRYVGPSRGNTSEFTVPLNRLLDEARDGVVWMVESGPAGPTALSQDEGAVHYALGDITAKPIIGPCPACGSDNINPVTVAGYGQVWICEGCDRQVPVPTLPAGVHGEVVRQRDDS